MDRLSFILGGKMEYLRMMDIYSILQQSTTRALTGEEKSFLREIIQEYPYFALARMIQAKVDNQDESIHQAATLSPNRTLLNDYLSGKKLLAMQGKESFSIMDNVPSESGPAEPKAYPMFSLSRLSPSLDQKVEAGQLFSLPKSQDDAAFHPYLNQTLKEGMIKYLPMVAQIQTQMAKKSASAKSPSQKEANLIIDQFLASTPKLSRPPARQPDQENNLSKVKKIKPDEDVVSETLARIHLKQKNHKEAIRIYKKLSLLFPEKSTYFDAQIQKIKELS
ncbi:MAG: hypothetical protein AAFR61_18605 [Bacteroidota bacterium]